MSTSAEQLNAAITALNGAAHAYNTHKAEFDADLASQKLLLNRPADAWAQHGYFGSPTGSVATQGSFGFHLTANGYRDVNDVWKSMNANGETGAAQIDMRPDGWMYFRNDAAKADGSFHQPTERMSLSPQGDLGLSSGVMRLGEARTRFKRIFVAHDASYSFTAPGSVGFAVLVADTHNEFPDAQNSANFFYDCGQSPNFVPGSVGTGVSLGTDAVANKINVDAPTPGALRVTNKLATGRSISLYLFGGEGQ